MNHINHTWITFLNKSYFFQNNFKIISKSHNDQQYAIFYFWLAYSCMFQRCCIASVMFKDIFLQFSYVNIQFFVIFQKIGVISLIMISDIKDMLFLHSYNLIKDKQPKNSLKQTFFIFLLHGVSIRMIKICGDSITFPLKLIFKSIINEGLFLDYWKKSNVVPIHKKE